MKKLFGTIVIILFIDFLTKSKMLLFADNPLWMVPDKLGFRLVYNSGVAFSLPLSGILAIFVSLSIVSGLFYYYFTHTNRNAYSSMGFAMVIGGALGNILDRIVYGHVIDFIQIYWYPIFNIADIFVSFGFIWIIFFHKKIQKV